MEGKQKPEKNPEKTTEKRCVQLNLQSVPSSVKNATVSDKRPTKLQRMSSSDTEAYTCTTDISEELKLIHQSLSEIRTSMVKNDDIKSIVTTIVSEIKGELKKEIIQEVKEELSKEIATTVTAKVRAEFDNKIDTKTKEFESCTKEISDGMSMDLDALKEKFHEQLKELRSLKDNMKRYQILTETAYTLANQNQQYSQKNNIKFLGWKEKGQENLRGDLCTIMKETAGVIIDPSDILEIHRIPGEQGKIRPVIAKFKNTETKVKVIKHRSKAEVKKNFIMFDHITQQNSQLIRQLNKDQRIQSAWYFNGKIFAVDHEGVRHKFDILDSVDRKLKKL